MIQRRTFVKTLGCALSSGWMLSGESGPASGETADHKKPVPVIDITDLYHPHQDVGDNMDLIAAYALPEIDLKAVILDATDAYRHCGTEGQLQAYRDETGPRDPGIIPVSQLNYIFDRNIPYGISPFTPLKDPSDQALDAPRFQLSGIDLIFKVLRESPEPVDILSFGSPRALAVAYNRDPDLMRRKVRRIHLAAGSSSTEFLEWNVMLDPNAMACLLRSDLPVAIYPCGTEEGAMALGRNNSFWKLENLEFIRRMHPLLQNYLIYAFERSARSDFLGMLEETPSEEALQRITKRSHNVWETALWAQVAHRELVQQTDGKYRLVPRSNIRSSDIVNLQKLVPCRLEADEKGLFTFSPSDKSSNFSIYEREDPKQNEAAFRDALPALYESFNPRA